MELFSLFIMIITLVGGLAMNSTQDMLKPLYDDLKSSNSTSSVLLGDIASYEFKLQFVTIVNVSFIVLLAMTYLYFTFKYVKVLPTSPRSVDNNRKKAAPSSSVTIEDGLEMIEVINPVNERFGGEGKTMTSSSKMTGKRKEKK